MFLAVHHVESGECDAQEKYCEPTRGLSNELCAYAVAKRWDLRDFDK